MPARVTIHEGTQKQASVGVGDTVLVDMDGKSVRGTVQHIELSDAPDAKYDFSIQLQQTQEYKWQSYICYVDRCKVHDADISLPD